MQENIVISKTIGIREAGHNEYWLQDRVFENPTILGLGEFDEMWREKRQNRGGRLDFLLGNSENGAMYEVEIMLGATDEKHIIHTLEYWDTQRKLFPKRSHTAVLVAERFERRFFNIIQLLSATVPLIAIQANLIDGAGKPLLHFTTILDAYEEPEVQTSVAEEPRDEGWWKAQYPATLEAAQALLAVVSPVYQKPELGYTLNYISLAASGPRQFKIEARKANKSAICFYVAKDDLDAISKLLDASGIKFNVKDRGDEFRIWLTADRTFIDANRDLFRQLAEFVKKWYGSDT